MTPFAAMARAPRASVTLMIAGKNSGVSPTASASENSSESTAERCSRRLAKKTRMTMTSMISVIR